MPFFKLTEVELRDVAKRHIETLEFWLRRVIDEVLTLAHGPRYWEAEPPVVKKDIREKVSARATSAPAGRFPRWIDATLIEHQIDLLTNEKLYKNLFKPYVAQLFPENFASGREYLKFILDKCATVRNALYHSNPVSVRQVEQTVCYTNDIIDSIKNYYSEKNMHSDFNAPSILSYNDFTGRKIYSNQMSSMGTFKFLNLAEPKFRCGDTIKMWVEVDSSFSSEGYDVIWSIGMKSIGSGPELIIELDSSHIGQLRAIDVKVVSKENWHRFGIYDDLLTLHFTVLPPI